MTLIKKENKSKRSWRDKDPALHSAAGSVNFILILAVVILFGIFLRIYLLADQILIDDEWQGMNYAAGCNSLFYLLIHFAMPGATCIPQNVYNYVLLNTTGWSEILLRLPSIICGILSMVIFPWLIRKVFSRRTTVIFTFLLAISPFLVFYSRVARPYSMVTFLGFVSIWALYLWATNGEKKYAVLYAVTGILAIYFHLFAVIGVLVPLGFAFLFKLMEVSKDSKKKVVHVKPSPTTMIIVGTVVILLPAVLVVPGLITSDFPMVIAKDRVTIKSLIGFARMLSGTAEPVWTVFFYGLLIFGLAVLVKRTRLLGWIFIVTTISYFGVIYLSNPASIHAPIVISRYVVLLFPLSFVAAALGMDTILEDIKTIKLVGKIRYSTFVLNIAGAGFLVMLFTAGPLIRIYSPPNNFTNHSAFQESYEPLNWQQSYTADIEDQYFTVQEKDMPSFYQQLAKEPTTTIIEYPMSYVNQFNLYYYYQHFHKKEILIGYFARVDLSRRNYIIWVDESLSIVNNVSRFRFRNMVNVENIEAIKRSEAKYIILHKNLLPGEWMPHNFAYPHQDYSGIVSLLAGNYVKVFGEPVFQDKNIIVFKIIPAKQTQAN